MRDFFIRAFEVLVGIIVVLLCIGVAVAAGIAAFGGPGMMGQGAPSGPLVGLGILIGGAIYVVFIRGLMYLGLGIYQNTRRTAEAVERLEAR